jgi:hypothetical protein
MTGAENKGRMRDGGWEDGKGRSEENGTRYEGAKWLALNPSKTRMSHKEA